MEYVGGAIALLSLSDYIAYGLNDHKATFPYRSIQALANVGVTYLLYNVCDLKTALAFGTMAWTWNIDLAFYGWGYLLNPSWNGRWENRSRLGLYNRDITWAGWTPIGLLRLSRDTDRTRCGAGSIYNRYLLVDPSLPVAR